MDELEIGVKLQFWGGVGTVTDKLSLPRGSDRGPCDLTTKWITASHEHNPSQNWELSALMICATVTEL